MTINRYAILTARIPVAGRPLTNDEHAALVRAVGREYRLRYERDCPLWVRATDGSDGFYGVIYETKRSDLRVQAATGILVETI